jgi:protein-disulfide isomerase
MSSAYVGVREMVLRRHHRRRARLVSSVAAGLLVAAVLLGLVVHQAQLTAPRKAPDHVPVGATADKAGLVVTSGRVRVDMYLDYLCPNCSSVETAAAPVLDRLRQSGEINLVYHPLGHLDSYSKPPGYSTRAASAAGCAADRGKLVEYSAALFAKQPPEGSPGLDDDQLIAVGRSVGITAPSFAACVRGRTYVPWVSYTTETAYSRDISATPTVLVGGKRIDVTPANVVAQIKSAAGRG